MASNIILSTDEIVVCPSCSNKFQIEEGITRQTIEKYKDEYQNVLHKSSKELEKQLLKENEKRMEKFKVETELKIKSDFDEERKTLKDDIEDKATKIKEFRQNEINLIKEQKKLVEEKQNFELAKERELKEATKEIEKRVSLYESQKFEFKEAEYKKRLEDAQKANAELTRKLDQGSQQLQGEVLEQELDKILLESFPTDDIREVAKGVKGADVVQCVHSQTGQICGTIIWEAKRAKTWSDKWLQKVKDDCISENADIAVIVSTNLPKDTKDTFIYVDGVWVCRKEIVRPVAETLRILLFRVNNLRIQNEGNTRKADLIYNYLSTTKFAQNLRSIFDSFANMKKDLDGEKTAMYRTWKKREGQLERVAFSMSTVVGQIQSISQDSLPELDKIPQLQLPGESEDELNTKSDEV